MHEFIRNLFVDLWVLTSSQNVAKFIIVLLFLGILLFIPIIISVLFPFVKQQLNARSKVYLYAFTTGFFIVMSTFGFMRESLEISSIYSDALIPSNWTNRSLYIYGYNILLVGGGVFFGVVLAYFIKFVISYRINTKLLASKKMQVFVHEHSDEHGGVHTHEHPTHIFNAQDNAVVIENTLTDKVEAKLKVIALVLLLTHRIPEGLLLGYNINLLLQGQSNSLSLVFIFSLILHLIPEEIVFYYRLRDSGFSKWTSLFISVFGLFLFLPFMLIGVYSGNFIDSAWEMKSFIFATIGGIFLFTSLVEFFPEFYHYKMSKKRWFKVIWTLFLGVIFAVVLLSIHTH
ncbi:ZIP family metal transporter [Mycoplasmopsis citelli]|uniref:ZIP Zinc transporter n=1 Tax=Mycoplasmopsis citelli TaxID=171281 RepID=A0A449B194_9BACT|nr:ZIP family metal transporter [Mycoplasmopsis citelli]UUD35839.1 ZIP family metal transporter [Mycoplasmopsis citelli]VEU74370.1 ZIP Zinc transporter [Mycoplasmopsis citelli]